MIRYATRPEDWSPALWSSDFCPHYDLQHEEVTGMAKMSISSFVTWRKSTESSRFFHFYTIHEIFMENILGKRPENSVATVYGSQRSRNS